jgi:hypothetical protein
MNRMRWLLTVLVVLGLVLSVEATENGGGAYPNGAEGLMSGALPPPGQYLVNYLLYYQADDLMDNDGHKLPLDFDATIFAEVARLINVSKVQVLGGAWAQQIFIPVTSVDVTTPAGDDNVVGLGDLIVDPVILAWHKPPFHWVSGVDVYVPVGTYDKDDLANVGRNYWTFEPVAAVTYLDQQGLELSAKCMYDFNLENPDTDYESGQELHVDFAAAWHVQNWAAGVGGFYYRQTTADDGTVMTPAGPSDAGDNKGEQIALGPQISCQYKAMSFMLASDFDFETQNKPQGERYWFKFVTGF